MSKRERNRRARVRRLSKKIGCSFDLAANIESAQRAMASMPAWARHNMYFAGTDKGCWPEQNP